MKDKVAKNKGNGQNFVIASQLAQKVNPCAKVPTSLENLTQGLADNNDRLKSQVTRAHELTLRLLGEDVSKEVFGAEAAEPETYGLMSSFQRQLAQQQLLLNDFDLTLDRLETFG